MNNEEMKKKMEFIVEQQAQFAVDIQVMREVQAQDVKLLKEQDRRLSDALVAVAAMIGNLTKAQTSSDERVNLLAEGLNRLAQAQARTEQSLKILINVVERHISGNGGTESPA
jgi:hypothetical protein